MLDSSDLPEEFVPLTREDPSAFSPPPAFGPFRVLHQIGIGALGPVFRTYEPARDRLVAVKVFRLDIVPEQAQALADALKRATQASLFHPSVVAPIAAGVEGTLAYRAEEYVAAESLDVAMRHYAPASLEKALPFVTQLAGAIDFARAAGIGHGALHPRDIFVTPDEARATGFGVVEALEQVGIRAPVRRPYSAPERIDGAAWGTPADIFSLAAITFELLTARRPSGTGAQIGALPDGNFSEPLHGVLARAMDNDPARRFPTALAFVSALEAAGRGESVEAPATSVAPAAVAAPAPVPVASPPPAMPVVVPPATRTPLAVPTAGEFEVEKTLDPVQSALDERTVAARKPDQPAPITHSLFDADEEPLEDRGREDRDVGLAGFEADDSARQFADEFIAEQEADAESRRPLEAVHETAPAAYATHGMFGAANAEPDNPIHDTTDRSRPLILPVGIGVVVGLLFGFPIGHFMGSRDREAAVETAAATPAAPAQTTGAAATREQPGQFSEQKVSPPPAAAAPARSSVPPPIPDETPASKRSAPPRTAAAAPARGKLVVTSTPTGAAVTINGDWRGRTPLTLDSLPLGRYVVRLVLPGHDTSRHEVTLSARDTTQEIRARLTRTASTTAARPPAGNAAPSRPPAGGATASRPPAGSATPSRPAPADVYTGSLYVDSRPRGATVFLDGRSVGQTPLSLPEVPIGAHVVRLELAGKKTWTSSTRVVAGEMARVTGSLDDRETPAPAAGERRMHEGKR